MSARTLLRPFLVAAASFLVAGGASAQGELPAGHPPVGNAMPPGHPSVDDDELPPGHPPMDPGQAQLPQGHPQVGQPPAGHPSPEEGGGMRMPAQSTSAEDASVPVGSIKVEVRDENDKPVAGQDVILGIVVQSIAQGEQRKRIAQPTGADGTTTFASLDTASQMAYRVSAIRDGATYWAPPFQLPRTAGERVVLHVFPVTHDPRKAQLAMQGIAVFELRDEVIRVEQHYRIFNVGTTTWVPENVVVPLPEGWKAFQAQKSMIDLAWDSEKAGVKLRGTIPPGMLETTFSYQLPAPSSEEMAIDFGLLPNVQSFRVIVEAPKGLTLDVDGFPQPVARTTEENQRFLVTEKETSKLDPSFRRVHMRLGNLPTRGQGRWIAVVVAVAGVAAGLVFAKKLGQAPRTPEDDAEVAEARARLLDELRALEKAKETGEVGPKTYEAARRALVDALARLLATEQPGGN